MTAEKPTRPAAEMIPSVKGGVSATASANAPVIFIDEFPNSGYYNGIAHITCEVIRFMSLPDGVTNDRVIVAHLRMNLNALVALKEAITNIEAIMARDGARLPAK